MAQDKRRSGARAPRANTAVCSDTIATVDSILHSALAEGALVVTPNRRLARFLHREFDLAQAARGLAAWPTPSLLPYSSWLEVLWNERRGDLPAAAPAALLNSVQAAALWRRIVDSDRTPLLDPRGAARLAEEAWTLVHAWGAGGESWRAWPGTPAETEDAGIFLRWAEQYLAALRHAQACDLAQVPDALAGLAARGALPGRVTILAGFAELTPQQQRLCAALAASDADMRRLDTLPAASAAPERIVAATARDELAAALEWSGAHVQRNSAARIGIVVEDLARRRDEVIALAEDLLCPNAILPGASGPMPFEISLGVPLATVPLIATALDLIALAMSGLDAGSAAVLLRSAYLPGAEHGWARRAAIERVWIDGGVRAVDLHEASAALEACAPDLAARWRRGRDALRRSAPATPREWADAWRAWLADAGWPGERPLDSSEYQAREAWEGALAEFTSLGTVMARADAVRATGALRALLEETIFQPEGSDASIQIMGVLEAGGLTFDALWVAGLAADRWPPAPAPNPLLPIAWQRERNVPRAGAARELEYARLLTARFARAAPEVVFSSPASEEDYALSPSALILEYAQRPPAQVAVPWWRTMAGVALEAVDDDRAPPLVAGSTAPGGSRIVAAQSDCPFQAVARCRLGAQPWPMPGAGLSRLERGVLVHATLGAFWAEVGDQAALLALDAAALRAAIDRAVERALASLPRSRWRSLPALLRDGEAQRLAALLAAWLATERARPPFVARALETCATLELAGLRFNLRLDRIDALTDGGLAIIDYKTGRVDRPAQWFDERPRSVQLGMYTLAQRAANADTEIRAVAYARLCADELAPWGLAADERAWPALAPVTSIAKLGRWPALEAWWRTRLGALAREIAQGHAAVAPRRVPSPCRSCRLQAVCRIESAGRIEDDALDA